MKRLGSMLIAFVMCVMVGVPAFAAEPQETVSVTKIADGLLNGECVVSLDGEEIAEPTTIPGTEATERAAIIPDLVRPTASPITVEVYPVITVPEDNNAAYTLNNLRRYKQLSGTAQSEYFELSASATATYMNEINNTMQAYTNQTGKTCKFAGWQVTCQFKQTATRPQYITMKPTASSLAGTDEVKQTIPPNYNTSIYTIARVFGPYREIGQRQLFGFNGAFYYKNETGTILSMMLASGFIIN